MSDNTNNTGAFKTGVTKGNRKTVASQLYIIEQETSKSAAAGDLNRPDPSDEVAQSVIAKNTKSTKRAK